MSGADGAGDDARSRLLAATVGYVAEHGLADLSLRALAAGIGTSHRMLIYHFGSKEGLLADVVATVEAGQRAILADLVAQQDSSTAELLDRFWAGLVDPLLRNQLRLFFEVVAMAVQGRPGTEGLRAGLIEPWLEVAADQGERRGLAADVARAQARLGMAVTRGLLLDLLATEDLDGVTAAWRAFVEAFATDVPRDT